MTSLTDTRLSQSLEENLNLLKEELGYGISFDVLVREFQIADKDAALVFLDGFAKDEAITEILKALFRADRSEIRPNTVGRVIREHLPYLEIETAGTYSQVIEQILAGPAVLLIDGEADAIIIDSRTYPGRGSEEPDLERVTRGSRDGFVETIIFNVALIRRRVRDPRLRVQIAQVGRRARTDMGILYIKDIANPQLVQKTVDRIKSIQVDAVTMGEKTVEEFLIPRRQRWNPFPLVRYTERPDVAAQHLFEGHVVVVVDTSPSAIILPVTLFHHLEHAEEYRQAPTVGAYLRLVRLLGILISWIGPPLWVYLAQHQEQLPAGLRFLGPDKVGEIPLVWQFVLVELGIDLIRMALIHTPNALATSLGFIGAILLGDMAVEVGLLARETIIYVSLAALGTFATPSLEFGLAVRLVRLVLLAAVGLAGGIGLAVAAGLILLVLMVSRSFGVPYLWPLIPLNLKALATILIRRPVPTRFSRPSILRPQDPDLRPGGK